MLESVLKDVEHQVRTIPKWRIACKPLDSSTFKTYLCLLYLLIRYKTAVLYSGKSNKAAHLGRKKRPNGCSSQVPTRTMTKIFFAEF